ncbi:hypothetical protein A2V49_01055 [candidate division WWE3 bacterium RBG_19FT_COMBO_34_6]|uniref:Uncharacterized protein n=1 Tax=candidate division WWE3 bacterium RBG_19FT_COMBO_34_6 TaxID=1802612 RepID=A0A1F4UKV6_UNCKA|nr:MAG: hypothetical protein A2V49_01055 [candidate division WWE3 bacterium RBG_19FT_COMBO_34_6]
MLYFVVHIAYFMKNFKKILITLFFSILIFIFISAFVVSAEYDKKLLRLNDEKKYYEQTFQNWEKYQNDLKTQIENVKKENLNALSDAKAVYENLLSQQNEIINNHTTASQQTIVTGSSQIGANKVTISKPKTVTKTKSS